jgi:hypothetical protein
MLHPKTPRSKKKIGLISLIHLAIIELWFVNASEMFSFQEKEMDYWQQHGFIRNAINISPNSRSSRRADTPAPGSCGDPGPNT